MLLLNVKFFFCFKLLETKIGKVQSEICATQQELERHEKELTNDESSASSVFEAALRTPSNSTLNRFISKLNSNTTSSVSKRKFKSLI